MVGGAKNIDFLGIFESYHMDTDAKRKSSETTSYQENKYRLTQGNKDSPFVILSHSTFTKVLDKPHKESRNYIWFEFI